MASDLEKAIDGVTPLLGAEAAEAVGNALSKLSEESDKPIVQDLLGWTEGAIRAGGPGAVVALKDWLVDLAKGDSVPPFPPGMSLRDQSDILAKVQNLEADEKAKWRDQMVLIGDTLGSVMLGIVAGMLKS